MERGNRENKAAIWILCHDEVQYCNLTPLISRHHGVGPRSEWGIAGRPISHIHLRDHVPNAQRLKDVGVVLRRNPGWHYDGNIAARRMLWLEPQGLSTSVVVRSIVPLENLEAIHRTGCIAEGVACPLEQREIWPSAAVSGAHIVRSVESIQLVYCHDDLSVGVAR